MNSLKLVRDEVTGVVTVNENSQYNNMKAEKLILGPNIVARIFGQVGDVILNEGSVLNIHGEITGNVENSGGTVHVFPL